MGIRKYVILQWKVTGATALMTQIKFESFTEGKWYICVGHSCCCPWFISEGRESCCDRLGHPTALPSAGKRTCCDLHRLRHKDI